MKTAVQWFDKKWLDGQKNMLLHTRVECRSGQQIENLADDDGEHDGLTDIN